jgi:hypothetical protein
MHLLRIVAALSVVASVPFVGIVVVMILTVLPPILVLMIFGKSAVAVGVAVLVAIFGMCGSIAFVAFFCFKLFGLIGRLRAPWGELAAGRDGLRWRRIARTRFAPWSSVSWVAVRDADLIVGLAGEREESFVLKDAGDVAIAVSGFLTAFRERRPAPALALLDAGPREAERWLARARGLLVEASYREQGVTRDVLCSVVADPGAPAAHRLGAALALGRAPEVTKAIDEVADPILREAMARAAAGTLGEAQASRALSRRR